LSASNVNSVTSGISLHNTDRNLSEVNEALALEEKLRTQKDNQKRYFYTLISNAKKVLGPKHMGYYTDNIFLFNEVLKENTSIDKWPEFIMKELNGNPKKWVDPKKLRKIQEL